LSPDGDNFILQARRGRTRLFRARCAPRKKILAGFWISRPAASVSLFVRAREKTAWYLLRSGADRGGLPCPLRDLPCLPPQQNGGPRATTSLVWIGGRRRPFVHLRASKPSADRVVILDQGVRAGAGSAPGAGWPAADFGRGAAGKFPIAGRGVCRDNQVPAKPYQCSRLAKSLAPTIPTVRWGVSWRKKRYGLFLYFAKWPSRAEIWRRPPRKFTKVGGPPRCLMPAIGEMREIARKYAHQFFAPSLDDLSTTRAVRPAQTHRFHAPFRVTEAAAGARGAPHDWAVDSPGPTTGTFVRVHAPWQHPCWPKV